MPVRDIAGFFFGGLTLFGFLPYFFSILHSQTKPKRVTWWIWAANSFILLLSYKSQGAEETIWLAVSYCIGCFLIAILTLKYGTGGQTSLDLFCLFGALVAILLWMVVGALATFLATLVIDLCGVIPTIYNAKNKPEDEDKLSWFIWFISAFGSLLLVEGLFSFGEWSSSTGLIVAYPFQIAVTSGLIVFFLVRNNSSFKLDD